MKRKFHKITYNFLNINFALKGVKLLDYRSDDGRFWLSAHNCQVQTPTSQNLELEQQIRIFGTN